MWDDFILAYAINWFPGRAWEPISRGSASQAFMEIGGTASGSALPGSAW